MQRLLLVVYEDDDVNEEQKAYKNVNKNKNNFIEKRYSERKAVLEEKDLYWTIQRVKWNCTLTTSEEKEFKENFSVKTQTKKKR